MDMIASYLAILGTLNWGLVGVFRVNALSYLPGVLETLSYYLVGLTGLYMLYRTSQGWK